MYSLYKYLFNINDEKNIFKNDNITVSVAESVTAGALSNSLCSEPGASEYFKGGIISYNTASKKDILNIDTEYAEKNNYANPSTTLEMAKSASKIFKSRIGIATTGYSTPTHRQENKKLNITELKIDIPYAIICLYDTLKDYHIIKKIEYKYDTKKNKKINRALVQTKVAIEGKNIYNEYIKNILDNK